MWGAADHGDRRGRDSNDLSMHKTKLSLLTGGLAVSLFGAVSAGAQETGNVIGPPQLRDFSLQPQERIVTQPTPPAQAPVQVAPPPPTTQAQPSTPAPRREREQPRPAPEPQGATAGPPAQAPAATIPPPAAEAPAPAPVILPPPAAEPAAPEATPAATPEDEAPAGTPYWLYLLGLVVVGLGAFALLRRRNRRPAEAPIARAPIADAPISAAPAAPAAPPAPRAEPGARPWIEIEVKAERAAFTQQEATVNFELAISNSGPVPARNLKVDVKLINAGAEQDKEIGAFFRTAGRDSTKLNLPGIGPDSTGVINGEVGMRVEDMRAVTLDGRMLFIPVMAINILYEWDDGRIGQSSKSYVVGRELEAASEKMGAFRVDQGPRIWRTIGQRPHKITRRI